MHFNSQCKYCENVYNKRIQERDVDYCIFCEEEYYSIFANPKIIKEKENYTISEWFDLSKSPPEMTEVIIISLNDLLNFDLNSIGHNDPSKDRVTGPSSFFWKEISHCVNALGQVHQGPSALPYNVYNSFKPFMINIS